MPSARWRHAVSDYSHANAHAVAPIAPPYARARAIAWRGSYTAHSCLKNNIVATQRMSTRRSQCDGDRIHPVRGRNGPAPPLRPPSSRPPPAWPAKPDRAAALQSPAQAQPPTQILGGPKRSKICPSRLCAHRTRIRIWSVRWGRSAGARCETRRRRALACVRAACGVYNRQRAARRKPRRSKTACITGSNRRRRMVVHCACTAGTGRRRGVLRMWFVAHA